MNYNNWYAVAVQSNKEKSSAAQLLTRKNVFLDNNLLEVSVLTRKEMHVKKDGKRTVKNKLLMPGYILVQVKQDTIENEDGTTSKVFPATTFDLIIQTPGVKFFTNCNKQRPRPMRSGEAKKMFDLCDEAHLEVKQNIQAAFNEGDILDVVSGPFTGYKCEVIAIQGNKILGQLDMFGRIVPAEFSKEQVYKNET